MELTGKCKEEFEDWFSIQFSNDQYWYVTYMKFDLLCDSAKYGVYVDFFESKRYEGEKFFSRIFKIYHSIKLESQDHNKLIRLSLISANELFNKSL